MVQELSYGWTIPGESEVSPEGLRTILGQVEAELYRSETYGQILSNLHTMPTEVGMQVQRMVKAVGREAIRLAFRRLVRKREALRTEPQDVAQSIPPVPAPMAHIHAEPEIFSTDAIASPPEEPSKPVVLHPSAVNRPAKATKEPPRRRLSKKELAAQAAVQAWQERLQELGQELRRIRQGRSLSLQQLHYRTQIPLYQLEALEAGQVERLPEDIYVRGFVRRIGTALGMDGIDLANSIPQLDPVKAILPTWQPPQLASNGLNGLNLRPMHLYFGYAALLVSGVAWVSQQSAPQAPQAPIDPPQPVNVTPPTNDNARPLRAPGAKATAMIAAGEIAPPEATPMVQSSVVNR